jgi:hypothetical protein
VPDSKSKDSKDDKDGKDLKGRTRAGILVSLLSLESLMSFGF